MRGLIVIATAVLAFGLIATPAHASGELGFSWDGRTWTSQLNGNLFDPTIRWVPGDERIAAFHLRNQARDGADLAINVESADGDRLLDAADIAISARVGEAGWVSLSRVADRYRLSARSMASGEVERVQIRAAFDPASTNRSQKKSVDLDFRVVLSDASAGTTAGGGPGGLLPDTGAPRLGWALVAAAGLIGAGTALLRRSKTQEVADV